VELLHDTVIGARKQFCVEETNWSNYAENIRRHYTIFSRIGEQTPGILYP
jgi:hypothetical protein